MMTQIEMDTMRAIISFSKEYRRQNMFIKLKGYFSFSNEDEQKIELLVKLKDVTGIIKNDGDGIVSICLNAYDYPFIITKEEYKEKLQEHINLAE